jgi:acetyl esterase/lipase
MERMTELMALPPDVATEPTTAGGVSTEWVTTPDVVIHVFQAFAPILPEGQQAIEKIGAYLRARWS